jgi:hypothetical protein
MADLGPPPVGRMTCASVSSAAEPKVQPDSGDDAHERQQHSRHRQPASASEGGQVTSEGRSQEESTPDALLSHMLGPLCTAVLL